MSTEMFVKSVEAEAIKAERDKHIVLAEHCNRDYEGEIARAGESVTIHVIGGTKIYILNKDGTYTVGGNDDLGQKMTGNIAGSGKDIIQNGIPGPDNDEATDITLTIKKIAFFHKRVGDYDKYLSSKKDLMGGIRAKIGTAIALKEDAAIAKTMAEFKESKAANSIFNDSTTTIVAGTAGANQINVLDLIDVLVQTFQERELGDEDIYLEGSAKFGRYLRSALGKSDTNNSGILAGKKVPVYNGTGFFWTNSTTVNGVEYLFARTKDAVAFADPFIEVKSYSPENGFADALKGFQLFDCGILFPEQLIWLKPKY